MNTCVLHAACRQLGNLLPIIHRSHRRGWVDQGIQRQMRRNTTVREIAKGIRQQRYESLRKIPVFVGQIRLPWLLVRDNWPPGLRSGTHRPALLSRQAEVIKHAVWSLGRRLGVGGGGGLTFTSTIHGTLDAAHESMIWRCYSVPHRHSTHEHVQCAQAHTHIHAAHDETFSPTSFLFLNVSGRTCVCVYECAWFGDRQWKWGLTVRLILYWLIFKPGTSTLLCII